MQLLYGKGNEPLKQTPDFRVMKVLPVPLL